MSLDDRPVLAVYVAWHPEAMGGKDLAEAMFTALCADPRIPAGRGLGIPVRFRTSNSGVEVPTPVPFGSALHNAVFVLADDKLVSTPAWRAYTDALCETARASDLVVPVALTNVRRLPPMLAERQAIRLYNATESERKTALLNDVMHDISRLLDPGAKKVKVFLSHAKEDGLRITNSIRSYLHNEARLDDFFDEADIPDGSRFGQVVTEHAGSAPALLAIQTDSYASREWCRLEILEAKRRHVPIVVLTAVEHGEARSFPYMGNVPVVRWCDDSSRPAVVEALLREVLRTRYFPRRAQKICALHEVSMQHEVFVYPPELLTALAHREQSMTAAGSTSTYLYPDPPLGTEEIELLRLLDPRIEALTPTLLRSR